MGMDGHTIEGPKGNMFEGDEWILPTDINLVGPAKEALLGKLKRKGWTNDDGIIEFVEDAVGEALINAIAHGNLGIPGGTENIFRVAQEKQEIGPTKKTVKFSTSVHEEEIVVIIRDEGEGFTPEKVPDSTDPENLLRPSGRGLAYMKYFADSIVYNKKGNEVTLIKRKR